MRFGWPNDDNQGGLENVIGCRGGSLFSSVSDGLILVTGRNGPSASCTMVFNAELKPLIKLSGLDAKPLGSSHIVLRQNLIHFSTQRSLDIWLVDLTRKTSRKIYPSTSELPARRDFRLARTAPVYIAMYRKLFQQPEVRYVDRHRFVDKFGEAALAAAPTQPILDWVWALEEKKPCRPAHNIALTNCSPISPAVFQHVTYHVLYSSWNNLSKVNS